MGDAEPAVCPHCGSSDTKRFDDSSGLCNACGRAFRGPGAVGSRMVGEDVEARKAAAPRERIKIGLLGLIGGILGFVGIPTVFLLGASLSGRDVSAYVSATFNRPEGVVACGGVTLLVIASWYTTWAAFHVWRGYPERTKHLVIAGALLAVAGGLAGLGVPGAVGIVGGLLALVTGLLVWRMTREKESEDSPPPSAPEST